MFDKIRAGALMDGMCSDWADLIVYTYQDIKTKEMAVLLGRDFNTTKLMLGAIYKHLGVKTKPQLMYRCAPYLKGEILNLAPLIDTHLNKRGRYGTNFTREKLL